MPSNLTPDTALGVTTERYEQVLELLETGTWPGSEEPPNLPVVLGARIGDPPYELRRADRTHEAVPGPVGWTSLPAR